MRRQTKDRLVRTIHRVAKCINGSININPLLLLPLLLFGCCRLNAFISGGQFTSDHKVDTKVEESKRQSIRRRAVHQYSPPLTMYALQFSAKWKCYVRLCGRKSTTQTYNKHTLQKRISAMKQSDI